jgi:hypothetical protein
MTMMQMESGYEVMPDDKIELHTGLHDAGSTLLVRTRYD